jgi:hypothetical protein
VEGRKDLAAVAIHFDEASVPMSYKMHINDYLSSTRQPSHEEGAEAKDQLSHAPAASPAMPSKE